MKKGTKKNVGGVKEEEKKKKVIPVEKDEDLEDEDLEDEEDVADDEDEEDLADDEEESEDEESDDEDESEDEEDEDVEEEEVVTKVNKKITVQWRGGVRTYSLLVHGKRFKELADEFIKKHNAVIVKPVK